MRRVYVGLSGPLAYDYKNQTDTYHYSETSAPNPLLEDSLGLLVFYDEIIFLSRHLCPKNMRNLPYVHFLSDRIDFENKFNVVYHQANEKYKVYDERDSNFGDPWGLYSDSLCNITGQEFRVDRRTAKYLPDNHSHQIYLTNDVQTAASSTWFNNVLIDWLTKEAFELENCDVLSNSGNSNIYSHLALTGNSNSTKTGIVNHLIVNKLPSYLTKEGPYHECLEELRNHDFISDMRSYIDELIFDSSQNEINKVAEEIESAAIKYREDVFKKHLSSADEHWSIGKAVALDVVGLAIPGVGTVNELMGARKREAERKSFRWTGFVCDLSHLKK